MMVYIRTKYSDVSFQARLPLLKGTQLPKDTTRNRLSDTCCIPAKYLGSEALPAQRVPTSHNTSLRASHIWLRVLFIRSSSFFNTWFVVAQPKGDFS